MKKKNLIIVETHDTGRHISPYGYKVPTPFMEKIAHECTTFRQCFSAGPTCSPSRSGLLTGYSPHENGMQGLAHRGWKLRDYGRHLAQYLRRFGFETILCGVQHVAPDYHLIGYETVVGSQNISMGHTEQSMADWDYANTDSICDYLEARHDSRPFFLNFGLFNTHREYPKSESKETSNYVRAPEVMYDCPETRQDMADFCASVQVVDKCLEKLVGVLRDRNLLDSTMIVFTTDHGIAFPRMKCTLYDNGIGVFMMIAFPDNPSKGEVSDALVSHYDLFPTFCDYLGVARPDWLEGNSLMPLLEKKTNRVRNEIFAEVTYHAAYEPKRCIRTERYKLIRNYDYHLSDVPANVDESLSKNFLYQHGYPRLRRQREYLFDLYLDPLERENLVGNADYGDVYDDLSIRLDDWMEKTHDPLFVHCYRVPKPVNALVNKRTCKSPRIDDFEGPAPSDYTY